MEELHYLDYVVDVLVCHPPPHVGLSSHKDRVKNGGRENARCGLGDVPDVLCHLLAAQALKVPAAVQEDRALGL